MPEDDKDGIAEVRWLPPLPQGLLVGLWLRGWPLVPAAQTDRLCDQGSRCRPTAGSRCASPAKI